jgi:hypothetical protein
MRKVILIFILLIFSGVVYSQQDGGLGPKEKPISAQLKVKKQIRRENREKRRQERAERKAVKKHHKRIQTKTVRKRMKESRATATRNNLGKREFFLKRWFRKKGRAKSSKSKKD